MNRIQCKGLTLVVSLAMLLALAACNRSADRTGNERFEAGTSTAKRAAAEPSRNARDASAGAAAPAHGAADSTKADSTRAMGAAREKVDDATITATVNASLAKDRDLSAIRIDVDTQDGVVTLSGLAPSASAKEHAGEIAHKVPGVSSVNNQLTIKSS